MVAVTTSPSCRYRGLRACRWKNSRHFVAGGSRAPSFSMTFGGAVSAVPPGVPVSSRSPAASGWNLDSSVNACAGRTIMSATVRSCRTSPLTDKVSRSESRRCRSAASTRVSHGPTGVKVGYDLDS
jgi:hypothetical protein